MTIAYIGLGSNIGTERAPASTLLAAVDALQTVGVVRAQSSLYESEPVGFHDQPPFVNAVVALESEKSAEDLLQQLLGIERSFGRDRSKSMRNGPRTLDLDLLLFGDAVVESSDLVLPHPRLTDRRFVLEPLAEIAPTLRHPLLNKTMLELLKALPAEGENRPQAVRKLVQNANKVQR